MGSPAFVPPPVNSWQGPAAGFVPPPVSSWEGPADHPPGALPGQAEKNQAILDRMDAEQNPKTGTLQRTWEGIKSATTSLASNPVQQGMDAYKAGDYGGVAKALGRAIVGPIYDIGAGAVDQGKKAYQDVTHGRYSEAVGHTAAALLPGIGPMAADIADTAGGEPAMPPGKQVEPPRPADVAGAVGKTAVDVGVPLAVGGAVKGARALTKVDPTIAAVRIWKPTPSDSGFTERLPTALSQVKAHATEPISGNETALKAIDNAISGHQQAYENWMDQARSAGVTAPGNPIVQATAQAIPDTMWRERPAEAQAIIDRAQRAYGEQNLTVDQLDRLRAAKNAELDAFYDKAEGKQIASEIAGTPLAVVKSQVEALRDGLYSALDPQGQGLGPRQIKRQQGDIIDLRDAALRRRNTIIGEKSVSTGEAIKRGLAGIADIPGKAVTGKLGEGTPINGPSDPLIRRMFDAVEPAEPLPQPPQINPAQKLIGGTVAPLPPQQSQGQAQPVPGVTQTHGFSPTPAQTFRMPAGPDSSGPVPQFVPPNMGSTSTRLLPAASSPVGVSGVIAPDMAGQIQEGVKQFDAGPRQLPAATSSVGVSGTIAPDYTGQAIQGTKQFTGGPPQIAAPEPGQPPLNVLPTGPGSVGPAGTVPLRSTERGIRMPSKSIAQTLGRAIIDVTPEPSVPPVAPPPSARMAPDEAQDQAPVPSQGPAGTGRASAVLQPSPGGNPVGSGSETTIRIPGNPAIYQARYALRELADIQPSHNPANLQPNPFYGLTNDRNYADPRNAERILKQVAEFDPEYLTTESPTAENGAPIIDKNGNVYAGNSRAITLGRVYGTRPDAAQAYRESLIAKAPQYGFDPQQIAGMKQPVLVRELTAPLDSTEAQRAVTDMNKVGTAALTPAEQAIADSRRMSGPALDFIGSKIEQQGPEGTLAQALEGKNGQEVVQKLIDEGLINTAEKNKYLNERGLVTDEGKSRISKLLVGRLFRDPAQLDKTAPELRNKLERVTPAIARVTGSDWDVTSHVQEAIELLDDARQRGIKNLEDLRAQQGMFGDMTGYSPEAFSIAKKLQESPTMAAKAFRQYANDANYAQEGTLLGNAPTMAEAFAEAFKPTAPQMRVPNGMMQPPR